MLKSRKARLEKAMDHIDRLWHQHLEDRFPEEFRGEEIEGIDLVLLDADVAGCISSYVASQGQLDFDKMLVLKKCRQELDKVLQSLEPNAHRYFTRLREITVFALESV